MLVFFWTFKPNYSIPNVARGDRRSRVPAHLGARRPVTYLAHKLLI